LFNQINQIFQINVFWKENLINWFYSGSDKFYVLEKFNSLNNSFNRLKR